MQNHQSGCAVHRYAGEVEIVPHAYEVGVGKLVVEQEVGVRAVSVIGPPRLLSHTRQRRCKGEI